MADSIANSPIVENWDLERSKRYLFAPSESDNQYRRGVVGCFTGDRKYPGAALMTTAAALATGVGMVRFLGSKSVQRQVIQFRPAVVCAPGKVDSLIIGSGVSLNFLNKIKIRKLISSDVPKVLDAAAIKYAELSKTPSVITPHAGELSRLIGISSSEIEAQPLKYAHLAAVKLGVTVLLKGHQSVVANGDRTIQLPEAPTWLATAGTGDVLAGILGALIAINFKEVNFKNLIELSATASFLHANAAMSVSPGPIDIENLINNISPTITLLLSK